MVPIDPALLACAPLAKIVGLRQMDAETFVEKHASGTLRKNKRIGMVWREQYLHERAAYELGWAFECLPRSRVTFGDAYTEGDVKALPKPAGTSSGTSRCRCSPRTTSRRSTSTSNTRTARRREGVGMVVRQTSAQFVPGGHLVFAIVAEFDPHKKLWHDAINPR